MAGILPVSILPEHIPTVALLCCHYRVATCHHCSASWAGQPGTSPHYLPMGWSGRWQDIGTVTANGSETVLKHMAIRKDTACDAVHQSAENGYGVAQMAKHPNTSALSCVAEDA